MQLQKYEPSAAGGKDDLNQSQEANGQVRATFGTFMKAGRMVHRFRDLRFPALLLWLQRHRRRKRSELLPQWSVVRAFECCLHKASPRRLFERLKERKSFAWPRRMFVWLRPEVRQHRKSSRFRSLDKRLELEAVHKC